MFSWYSLCTRRSGVCASAGVEPVPRRAERTGGRGGPVPRDHQPQVSTHSVLTQYSLSTHSVIALYSWCVLTCWYPTHSPHITPRRTTFSPRPAATVQYSLSSHSVLISYLPLAPLTPSPPHIFSTLTACPTNTHTHTITAPQTIATLTLSAPSHTLTHSEKEICSASINFRSVLTLYSFSTYVSAPYSRRTHHIIH